MDPIQDPTTTPRLKQLVDSFFQAVSFEPGKKPFYSKLSQFFIPEGLLIRAGESAPEITTVSQFILSRQALVDSGELTWFKEFELSESTEIFGSVAQRFSAYAKEGSRKGLHFNVRGMICIQFITTLEGWKISSMAWDDERADLAIPESYQLRIMAKQTTS